jgi:hypothetical protein
MVFLNQCDSEAYKKERRRPRYFCELQPMMMMMMMMMTTVKENEIIL